MQTPWIMVALTCIIAVGVIIGNVISMWLLEGFHTDEECECCKMEEEN